MFRCITLRCDRLMGIVSAVVVLLLSISSTVKGGVKEGDFSFGGLGREYGTTSIEEKYAALRAKMRNKLVRDGGGYVHNDMEFRNDGLFATAFIPNGTLLARIYESYWFPTAKNHDPLEYINALYHLKEETMNKFSEWIDIVPTTCQTDICRNESEYEFGGERLLAPTYGTALQIFVDDQLTKWYSKRTVENADADRKEVERLLREDERFRRIFALVLTRSYVTQIEDDPNIPTPDDQKHLLPERFFITPIIDLFNHDSDGFLTGMLYNNETKEYALQVITRRDYLPGEELKISYGQGMSATKEMFYWDMYLLHHEPTELLDDCSNAFVFDVPKIVDTPTEEERRDVEEWISSCIRNADLPPKMVDFFRRYIKEIDMGEREDVHQVYTRVIRKWLTATEFLHHTVDGEL